MRAAAAASDWSFLASLWPFLHVTASSSALSHRLPFLLSLSLSVFSLSFFLCCRASLSLPLLSAYIIDTEDIYESCPSPENRRPLLCLHLLLLFICLLHLYSSPSGQPADKVSFQSTNGTITLDLFFTACPACSGKLLLNCSSILQMNCLDNSILLLSFQRSRGAGEDLADG